MKPLFEFKFISIIIQLLHIEILTPEQKYENDYHTFISNRSIEQKATKTPDL